MLTFNNKILTVSNKGLEVEAGPTPPAPVPALPFSTVQIGSKLWSAEDIKIDDNGTGITKTELVSSKDSSIKYGEQYYYTADAAARIAAAVAADYPGWHIPTEAEWTALIGNYTDDGTSATAAAAMNVIASIGTGTWYKMDNFWNLNGTVSVNNSTGFSAIPISAVGGSNETAMVGMDCLWHCSDTSKFAWVWTGEGQASYTWGGPRSAVYGKADWAEYYGTTYALRLVKDA